MSQFTDKTSPEHPIKPTAKQDSPELTEKDLDKVSGGINPQPLPPAARRQ